VEVVAGVRGQLWITFDNLLAHPPTWQPVPDLKEQSGGRNLEAKAVVFVRGAEFDVFNHIDHLFDTPSAMAKLSCPDIRIVLSKPRIDFV
jgi:hypothetical protein